MKINIIFLQFVCCPDYAIAATTTTAPRTTTVPRTTTASKILDIVLPSKNYIQNHPNLRLLNEKKCGTSSANRIVGGEHGK